MCQPALARVRKVPNISRSPLLIGPDAPLRGDWQMSHTGAPLARAGSTVRKRGVSFNLKMRRVMLR
jgi:hypothetical protein